MGVFVTWIFVTRAAPQPENRLSRSRAPRAAHPAFLWRVGLLTLTDHRQRTTDNVSGCPLRGRQLAIVLPGKSAANSLNGTDSIRKLCFSLHCRTLCH